MSANAEDGSGTADSGTEVPPPVANTWWPNRLRLQGKPIFLIQGLEKGEFIRYNRIERTGASPNRTEQRLDVSPGEHDDPTVARQRQRDCRSDAAAGAGNHGDSRHL